MRRYSIISNIVLTLAIFAQVCPGRRQRPTNRRPGQADQANGASTPKKHPFTFEDMMALKRVGGPVVSPDGKWVLSAVDVSLNENKKTSHLWSVPVAGGEAHQLTADPAGESRPKWSPDGKGSCLPVHMAAAPRSGSRSLMRIQARLPALRRS